ncbi:type I site-specific deoxyribonuclease [Dokdonia sp. MED134]|uniref:restriction endonuclease subunit S n=1 Tax=Dokdonia sp. MED134 TaxID=313590 RepID=UPI000068AC2C|nr:restriction endonuclease subunit S [Dokdonia sp. MED134]EAQ40459.1 type I site-specific deoxyribonuclease [Dokdonia sp. MED134]
MVAIENKVQRYDSYKDSGVEWLGEIPEHWQLGRLGSILNPVSSKNHPNETLLSITREKGVIVRDIENEDSNHNFIPDDLTGYKLLKKGQFGMNKMKAWQGSYGVSSYTGIVSPAYYTFEFTKEIEPRFFHIAIRSKMYVSFFGKASDGVRIGQWDLSKDRMKRIPLAVPPLPEQTAIAEFLDDKTTKIDDAIGIKQQQINLLKERKQILIHKAVTRGLDDSVTLKDSGVEWIGEIPEHWKVKRFRYIFQLGKGLTITKENLKEEGVFCVNYGEIHSKYGFEVDTNIQQLKCVDDDYLESNTNALIKEGDFVFADTSEDIEGSGNFTYLKSKDEIFAGYHTVVAKPKFKINSRFFAYVFESQSFRNQIRTKVKGVKVYSVTQSILKEPNVWYPSIQEQREIVDFLDIGTRKIETAIGLKEQEIEKLKEYKGSLINGVVTGKVRVC